MYDLCMTYVLIIYVMCYLLPKKIENFGLMFLGSFMSHQFENFPSKLADLADFMLMYALEVKNSLDTNQKRGRCCPNFLDVRSKPGVPRLKPGAQVRISKTKVRILNPVIRISTDRTNHIACAPCAPY